MKVVFIGELWNGSNALSLAEGFTEAGGDVRLIDTTPFTSPGKFTSERVHLRRNRHLNQASNNKIRSLIHDASSNWRADMLIAFGTTLLDQESLLAVPATHHVHYSPDDMGNPANLSAQYLESESRWSMLVTTKRHNIDELRARGAKNVLYVDCAYDPRIHRGEPAVAERPYNAGFIGAARSDRLYLPHLFADVIPRRGVIYGPRWRRHYPLGYRKAKLRAAIGGRAFSSATAEMFAGPILLNSDNRDRHTCRSFEMPACGVLAIAERTEEHQMLLNEEEECLMFSSREELAYQLERVSSEPRRFELAAAQGQRRVLSGNNTYFHRASTIISAAT